MQALISLALSITAKLLETPHLRDLLLRGGTPLTLQLALTTQLARDVNDALRDTSIPASTRLTNAAALYMQHLMDRSAGFISVSTRSFTTWKDLSSVIRQHANIAIQVQDEIKHIFGTGDEAATVHPEATVDPTSKEAARFTKKQSLICQVLIACSDAQTMTGICLTRRGAG